MKYEEVIHLSITSIEELKWWVNNVILHQGSTVKLGNPDMVIYTDTSSSKGWGASLEGGYLQGSVDQERKRGPSHKRVRIKGSGNSTENIPQGKEPQTRTYLYGQHDSGVLPHPQRGDKVCSPDRNIKKNLEVPPTARDHDYCVMDPFQGQQNSRLEVQTEAKLQRMGIMQQDIIQNSEYLGQTRDRLLCLKNNE